jgi:hypothetical protein
MADIYVERELIVDQNGAEKLVAEPDILMLGFPLVVLGDPGIGKTKFTESLAVRLEVRRFSAGTFVRSSNLEALRPPAGLPIIVDGLDELTTSTGASAVDEVLKKLALLGCPPFILSCRAADWNGSADRQKIREDYGIEPTTATLKAFSRGDAKRFLSGYQRIDAEELLEELDRRDLSEFYTNPLTLKLIAELTTDSRGLPNGRADLFERASRLLVLEDNPIHQRGEGGMANPEIVLDSSGAIFAHLLLSGSLGIADLPPASIPLGFVARGDLAGIPDAPLTDAALKSRLFRGDGENLLVPYHRVVAEFLAARWLAKRLGAGLSERRAVQALTFAGGVPTALRGLHAWFGHFAPRMTEVCIRTDPYGALRYGDPDRFSLSQARLLLQSLVALANEDPYFRSEDWGRRALAGLARSELKFEILHLLKRPDRHAHLLTLILEAVRGSPLAVEIVPELTSLLEDENAIYLERYNAAKALLDAKVTVDWPALLRKLRESSTVSNKRLALEVMGQLDLNKLTSEDIGDALLDYHGIFRDQGAGHILGSDYLLLRKLSSAQSSHVLDHVSARIAAHSKSPHWTLGYNTGRAIHHLINTAIEEEPPPAPNRLWRWLRLIEHASDLGEGRSRIGAFPNVHTDLRRALQRLSFSDDEIDGAPWMAIVHHLPKISSALAVTAEDALIYLDEIASRESLSNCDIELWKSLLHINRGLEGFPASIEQAAQWGIERHPQLQCLWDELTAPPKSDWRKEELCRQEKARRDKQRRFRKHRQEFAPHRLEIASDVALGVLYNCANVYLDRYSDMPHEGGPVARLHEWLGDDLAKAALEGFVRVLSRTDLPTVKQISENHVEGKTYNTEPVLVCGIAELVRRGQPLGIVSREVLKATLAAWWEYPIPHDLDEGLGGQLEAELFTSDVEIAEFLTTVMEPRIRAGHEHASKLYELSRDQRYRGVARRLAFAWLRAYPVTAPRVQKELLDTTIRFAPRDQVQDIVRERVTALGPDQVALRPLWMAALFFIAFQNNELALAAFCDEDRTYIWALRGVIRSDNGERWLPLSIGQLEFMVEQFAERWPPAALPHGGSWGDENAHDAAEFLRTAIRSIGADSSREASKALDRLAECSAAARYRDEIKHVRAQQQRLRRDTEYSVPSFAQVKSTLSGGLPETIDDLKTVILDAIEAVQLYSRQGDTIAWRMFWSGDTPLDENTCRDRLLDLMRGHIQKEIAALPETRMPDAKRADVAVIYNGMGLPVEIKGQWHNNVWDAPSEQLIELYTKDYRANGRGIYLVLWFGPVAGKNLVSHPDGRPRPGKPEELRQMLLECLDPSDRSRVDVVVLNVSPT